MGAKQLYQVIGCYQQGSNIVGYHLQCQDGTQAPYTREQVMFLAGRNQLTNCDGSVFFDKQKDWLAGGKVILRGTNGTTLESLPVKKLEQKPAVPVQRGNATGLSDAEMEKLMSNIPDPKAARRAEIAAASESAKPMLEAVCEILNSIPGVAKTGLVIHNTQLDNYGPITVTEFQYEAPGEFIYTLPLHTYGHDTWFKIHLIKGSTKTKFNIGLELIFADRADVENFQPNILKGNKLISEVTSSAADLGQTLVAMLSSMFVLLGAMYNWPAIWMPSESNPVGVGKLTTEAKAKFSSILKNI